MRLGREEASVSDVGLWKYELAEITNTVFQHIFGFRSRNYGYVILVACGVCYHGATLARKFSASVSRENQRMPAVLVPIVYRISEIGYTTEGRLCSDNVALR